MEAELVTIRDLSKLKRQALTVQRILLKVNFKEPNVLYDRSGSPTIKNLKVFKTESSAQTDYDAIGVHGASIESIKK